MCVYITACSLFFPFSLCSLQYRSTLSFLNILALQYPDSGKLSTDVPDVDTGIDWLVYLARYSQQCQAQSHFVVRSRLDIVENTEIMVGPNQSFYCGTLRPDCRPFRTGIFIISMFQILYQQSLHLDSCQTFLPKNKDIAQAFSNPP